MEGRWRLSAVLAAALICTGPTVALADGAADLSPVADAAVAQNQATVSDSEEKNLQQVATEIDAEKPVAETSVDSDSQLDDPAGSSNVAIDNADSDDLSGDESPIVDNSASEIAVDEDSDITGSADHAEGDDNADDEDNSIPEDAEGESEDFTDDSDSDDQLGDLSLDQSIESFQNDSTSISSEGDDERLDPMSSINVVSSDDTGNLIKDENGKLHFELTSGKLLVNSFKTINGVTYYFGDDGYAVSGKQDIKDKMYYFDTDYSQVLKWQQWEDGTWSYFDPRYNGAALKGWNVVDDIRRFFDRVTRCTLIGLNTIDGKVYYFKNSSKGSAYKGKMEWKDEEGSWSWFSPDHNGAAFKGKNTVNDKVYYFELDSRRAFMGWKPWDDGTLSYFSPKFDGAALKGKNTVGEKVYYFYPSTRKTAFGWISWDNGRRSYFSKAHGGAAFKGWNVINDVYYYFNRESRQTLKGRNDIGKYTYYFSADGSRYSGWVIWNAGGVSYFGKSNGRMYTGIHSLQGLYGVNFGSNGINYQSRTKMVAKAQKLFGKTKTQYVVMVNADENYVGVFEKKGTAMVLNKYWRCSTGMPGHTIYGTYYTNGDRGDHFGESSGYTCYHWTRIHKGVLFHSIQYYPYSMTVMDGRLGYNISHGCIRLAIENALWINQNIFAGTAVQIYNG